MLLRDRLSERELAVLDSLHRLRLMTGAQVQRLHIADGSPHTRAQRARALLQHLADLKLVVRLGRRVGGKHAGSKGFVYGLSGHGQAVLGLHGLHGGRRLARHKRHQGNACEHHNALQRHFELSLCWKVTTPQLLIAMAICWETMVE